MKKATVISWANFKGGVAKSSSTASVGSILASKGKRVLIVDLDAQTNLTVCFLNDEEREESIYSAMLGKSRLPIVNIKENLDLIPASVKLAMIDLELASAFSRERILADLLEPYKEKYDYILLDCPPSLSMMTLNALTASDHIIIPLVAEVLPFVGLKMMNDFIMMVNKRLNPNAHILGILITRFENVKLSRNMESSIRQSLGDIVFSTKIRKNIKIAEAPLEKTDIYTYNPTSNGAQDYVAFTEELLKRLGHE